VWAAGDILSLDSGGNYKGYIGDLCRMAIQGEPDSELEDLLGEIDEIQMAARKPIRPGVKGGDIYAGAGEVLGARRAPTQSSSWRMGWASSAMKRRG
jgi:Xaa-Pro aminopeptidase